MAPSTGLDHLTPGTLLVLDEPGDLADAGAFLWRQADERHAELVEQGELRGIVDFDVVCYGDPLYWIALTQTAIVCDVGEHRLFYADELCRAMDLDEAQREIVNVYAALFAGSFLETCRANGDAEAERRLLDQLDDWLEKRDV